MKFEQAVFEAAFGTGKQLPPSAVPEVAFSGRSNVGKSSLLNKLFNRKSLARVSATPGKTITVNFYRVGEARMVDLPGYGYAKRSQAERRRWSELMETYFSGTRDIRLVVQLIDMRHPPTEDDFQMLEFLRHMEIPFVIALTKSDKLNKTERARRLEGFREELAFLDPPPVSVPFSSAKGEGVEELKRLIEAELVGESHG